MVAKPKAVNAAATAKNKKKTRGRFAALPKRRGGQPKTVEAKRRAAIAQGKRPQGRPRKTDLPLVPAASITAERSTGRPPTSAKPAASKSTE
ncbi:hypothetical protein M3Y99_01414500 [Aphelenchoides fujianensis]|nr:hypothetical protein M3Y99_01414500 [Aphelenchoides fujianensis]